MVIDLSWFKREHHLKTWPNTGKCHECFWDIHLSKDKNQKTVRKFLADVLEGSEKSGPLSGVQQKPEKKHRDFKKKNAEWEIFLGISDSTSLDNTSRDLGRTFFFTPQEAFGQKKRW